MTNNRIRVIAHYLPQFHPIPENDRWWGKGFTEWTNVGKAKPLFKGHNQPRIPADLGYYDLRVPETREMQASIAREHGVEGFCYWHYWFGNGQQLLERPFNEVLNSGSPDFPFCLAWANHDWLHKQFHKDGSNKMLMPQLYPGEKDYTEHFYALLPAFKDHRYIRVDDRPLFMIYDPMFSDVSLFITLWRKLARKNGLEGIHFITQTFNEKEIESLRQKGFDAITIIRLYHFIRKDYPWWQLIHIKIMRKFFKRGQVLDFKRASKYFFGEDDRLEYCYPTVIPNYDHSPRSGFAGHIFVNSTPSVFFHNMLKAREILQEKEPEHRIVFLRSWNEWGEGNYVEPDLTYGLQYLQMLKKVTDIN